MTHPEDRALEVAGAPMPSARSIAAELKAQLNAQVLAERQRRGEVHLPEDAYPMFRALGRTVETLGEYARAFGTAAREARSVAEEELVDLVGEQDGMPNQGLTIPDADGDVAVTVDIVNSHEFDRDALFTAVAFDVIESLGIHNLLLKSLGDTYDESNLDEPELTEHHERLDNFLADLLTTAMTRLVECGKFDPQVSKVKAFTSDLARNGGEQVAATVNSSHRVHRLYKGVKVERKPAKARK